MQPNGLNLHFNPILAATEPVVPSNHYSLSNALKVVGANFWLWHSRNDASDVSLPGRRVLNQNS